MWLDTVWCEKDQSAFKSLKCALTSFFGDETPRPSLTKPIKYAFGSIIEGIPLILLHGIWTTFEDQSKVLGSLEVTMFFVKPVLDLQA